MAVTLSGSGGLFTRIGKLGYVLSIVDSFMATTGSDKVQKELNDALVEYDGSGNRLRNVVDILPDSLFAFVTTQEAFYSDIQNAAQQTLIEMVHADDPLPVMDVDAALKRLIDQMVAASATVDANEPSASVAADSGNSGTAKVLTTLTAGDGTARECLYAEDIVIEVQTDTTARGESLICQGEESLADNELSVYWPDGSSSSNNLTMIDPSADGVLANGSFEDWTASDPDSWTITGTLHSEETSTVFLGASSLKITGNGSGTTVFSQDLSSAGLASNTNYVCHVAYRIASNPAAGSLKLHLYDGSGDIIASTIDLTTATTGAWVQHAIAFRIPSPLPTAISFRMSVLGPLSNAAVLFVDAVCFGVEMIELYDGGPFVSVIGSNDNVAIGDKWTVTISNDYRGALQTLCWRLWQQPTLQLPSATGGSETIADSLIG